MKPRHTIGQTIKAIRKQRKLTQEDFGVVSSRTYLSTLERGLKNPTLDKLDEISQVMGIHPATLVLLAYISELKIDDAGDVVDFVCNEARALRKILGHDG